jgi:probable O-glycosylation ligase (exosortase A-associated)
MLTIWITISWLLAVDAAADYEQWKKVMKIYFMTFVALAVLQTKHQLLAFAWVTAASLALLGVKGGVFTVLHGGSYRVWGPPGSFIEDNNEFALALIMTIPILRFLQLQTTDMRIRHGLTAVMLLCAASALGSHSRGGLLAMAAMGVWFWWRSPRKAVIGIWIAMVAFALLPMMPEEWWNRMASISTYEEDASAMGRVFAWEVAWKVAVHHFFGAGMSYQHPIIFAMYGDGAREIAAHSIYFQVLGNHGFVGLFLFLAIWFATYRSAGRLWRRARDTTQAKWAADLGAMMQVSLVGYAVGGAFLSLAYFDLPYNVMVLVVLARKWVETRAWEREPQLPFLEYVGLRKPKLGVTGAVKPEQLVGGRTSAD